MKAKEYLICAIATIGTLAFVFLLMAAWFGFVAMTGDAWHGR